MYIIETTGSTVDIQEYTGDKNYTINYIITRNGYYDIDSSVFFGELAGW
jgi:hypothetical protein